MFSIAVVDDEPLHRDLLTGYIKEWSRREQLPLAVETFASSEAFYFSWCEDQRFDVLFLDIMMKGTDGVSLARKLREKGRAIAIVFTTGIADYMEEGYGVEALHYLLKPLDQNKVWECLNKCRQKKEDAGHTEILVPTEDGLIKIQAQTIVYAEAAGHYCELECMQERLCVKTSIRDLEQILCAAGDFLFCHRSYLVNIQKISRLNRQDIRMDNGSVIPVSRRLYPVIYERFLKTFVRR